MEKNVMNKDEADRCIEIAEKYIKENNREMAKKYLQKADRMYPSQKAKDLLSYINLLPPTSKPDDKYKKKLQAEKPLAPEVTSEQRQWVSRVNRCNDYYEILGVDRNATDFNIKQAYKKLALQLHPDKNKAPGSAEAFKAIGKAVEVLTDAEKKRHYDLFGSDEQKSGFEADETRRQYDRSRFSSYYY